MTFPQERRADEWKWKHLWIMKAHFKAIYPLDELSVTKNSIKLMGKNPNNNNPGDITEASEEFQCKVRVQIHEASPVAVTSSRHSEAPSASSVFLSP